MSQLSASGGQGIGASEYYSGLIPFRIDWFDLLSVQTLSKVFSNTTVQKHQFFSAQLSTLTSINNYWKNHTFDFDLCQQINVSVFQYAVYVGHNYFSKEQVSVNCKTAVTMDSDFGAQENSLSLFPLFPRLFSLK